MNHCITASRRDPRAVVSRRSLLVAGALALLGVVVAPVGAEARPLVLAASSLKDAIEEVGGAFALSAGVRPRYSFAASSTLARQLEQGIEAELFLSADLRWMDYAVRQGLVDPASVVPLLGNRLVLVAPRGTRASIDLSPAIDLVAALEGGRLALADARAVPAGRYARAALESLGQWARVSRHLAMTENVRAALALAARGEVPLAIVYETDARAEPRVEVVGVFTESSHPPIRYPLALVKGRRTPGAIALHAFLRGTAAARIFTGHGFVVLG